MKIIPFTKTCALVGVLLILASNPNAPADETHAPGSGDPQRTAILDTLHHAYTTGSGPNVKFLVKYLKVHNGWAWIKVVPLDPKGNAEGDEWPSLLQDHNGRWVVIDLIAAAQNFNEADGPADPSAGYVRALQKKYPSLPADIVPAKQH
jgi:hypothetical protein